MHYLHIFNVCNVTNIHKNKTTTYHTNDYAIKLKEIRPFPDALYRLTITTKTEQTSILDNIQTPAGCRHGRLYDRLHFVFLLL